MDYLLLLMMLFALIFLFSTALRSASASDQQSLLAFKAAISLDPNNSLANWNTNISVCNWTGVTCSPDLQSVTKLALPDMGLEGTISPMLGNLSAMESLNLNSNALDGRIPASLSRCTSLGMLLLHSNQLQGSIPVDLSLLPRLWMLDLGVNHLTGTIHPSLGNLSTLIEFDLSNNNLHGPIPTEVGMLTKLKWIYLYGNELSGTIPSSLGNLSVLIDLELQGNNLTGPIPGEISMLTKLHKLSLSANQLSGTIPSSIGNLKALTDLELYADNLTGTIPSSIGNLTALNNLVLSANNLTGSILPELGMLANLQSLYLWGNEFSGTIPKSLGNCSNLSNLNLRNNQLSGIVPIELGKLHLLEKIRLDYNQLVSGSSNSLSFLTALTNCSHLQKIKMSYNHFTGVLPPSIGHLSSKLSILQLGYNRITGNIPKQTTDLTNLTHLDLTHNRLNGDIPSGFRRFYKLERLDLSGNRLEGSLPEEIGQMQSLGLLDVSWNKLSGRIPGSLARLHQLRRLFLHHNHFSGEIPDSLKRCKNLELLDVSHNDLGGRIPGEFMASLMNLQFYLNLSWNNLQGPLPGEISKIVSAQAIDISGNQLDGMIPAALANCIALANLNLSHNAIEGLIPDALGKLQNLESIDLSFNFLSGTIPTSLGKIKVLRYLNVCFNNLTGQIPEGGLFPNSTVTALFMGNDGLCGPKQYFLPACPKQGQHRLSLLAKVLLSAGGIIAFILWFLILRILWCQKESRKQFDLSYFMFGRLWYPKFTYNHLVIATNGFNETNLLGVGRFGSVYRGVLKEGKIVAIKVLNLQSGEVQKSFKKECKVLGRTRHRNLARVISVCSYPDFKALILQFAENGSLEKHLYPNNNEEVCELKLGECLNIAIDVAHAMEYLHYDCPVQIVHCDLKPSNVLLDVNMTTLVTDFGISRLTGPTNSVDSLSTTFSLRGSIGYIAPEYGLGTNISVKGDVYSYGILLLEMITRKRPTDAMFVEDLNLQKWVRSAFPHRLADIVDSRLLANVNMEQNNCLVSFIDVGLLCTNESPQERPTMRDVCKALEVLRTTFTGGTATASYLAIPISDLVCYSSTAEGVSDSQSSTF